MVRGLSSPWAVLQLVEAPRPQQSVRPVWLLATWHWVQVLEAS